MDQIIEALRAAELSAWRLTETRCEAAELYFIKKKLDIPRCKDIRQISVEIFRDFEEDGRKLRGSTTFFAEEGRGMENLKKKIKDAYYAASFVKNPYYDLPAVNVSPCIPSDSDLRDMSPEEAAAKLADVLLSVSSDDRAFINSAEIFVRRTFVRILDSKGTDVSYVQDSVSGEFVAQCREPEDVEQFRQFSYGGLDLDSLKKRLEDGIRDARMRSQASASPKAGRMNLLLTGENLRELLNFYQMRSSSALIYPGYSDWETGRNVQGKLSGGEKLNLTLASALPFSEEGISLKDRPLLEDGVLKTIHGPSRFASYLGIEPTGIYEKLILDAGSMSYEEMKKGSLEAVSFSDFQMDVMDGHFAGEIRLALRTGEDGKVTPLTGGSVNGNILDSQGKLIFSRERYKDSSYEGPLAVLIPDVMVAGC